MYTKKYEEALKNMRTYSSCYVVALNFSNQQVQSEIRLKMHELLDTQLDLLAKLTEQKKNG